MVDDPSESPLYLPTLQLILPPNEDQVENEQEEQRRGIHQLHPVAGGKRGGVLAGTEALQPCRPRPLDLTTTLSPCKKTVSRWCCRQPAKRPRTPRQPRHQLRGSSPLGCPGGNSRTGLPGAVAAYLPAGWLPEQPNSRSTASSMSEAPGQWKQEQRLPWCRKLLLHIS